MNPTAQAGTLAHRSTSRIVAIKIARRRRDVGGPRPALPLLLRLKGDVVHDVPLPLLNNGMTAPLCRQTSGYVLGTDLNCSESLASHRQWPVIHPFEITHIQGLGSFAVGENAPKGCDQPIKFDRLRIKLVAPRRERLFAFTGERVRGQRDDGDVAGLRIALEPSC